ncbi:envelope glycoprotein M [Saimiriine alphaherpesvirus 1]|uniref:Envelope glycoprotein M n=1 Tax=Saimiriine herpesvirus 1 (strain MV-5-4-PSL) TaxID=10353 RepID=E2IUG0_SHV1|nr:envelope glycoprotein M [Saimiriine alphaherpesvirus 1]ADO13818.1 envelope glycoprotein M [Saimiriine alphaherpesvirus 1]
MSPQSSDDEGPSPSSPAAKMARLAKGVWAVQTACFLVSVIMLVLLTVVACFFDAGLARFYAPPNTRNDTRPASDVHGGVTSALQPDAKGAMGTFVITAGILLVSAIYVIVGAVTARGVPNKDPEAQLAAVSLVAPQSALLLGSAAAWLLQVAVVLLARRVASLGYVAYGLHSACLAAFGVLFCTRGVLSGTYAKQARGLERVAPTHYRVVGAARAVVANVVLLAVCLATAMMAVAAETVAVENFAMTPAEAVAWAAGVFACLVIVAAIVVEMFMARYVQVLPGPHLGLVIACGIIGVAVEAYYARNYYVAEARMAGARTGIRVVLALLAGFVLVMAVVRLVRAYVYHKRRGTKFSERVRATRDRAKRQIGRVRASMREAGRKLKRTRGGRDQDPLYAEIPYTEVPYAGESTDEFDDEEPVYEIPTDTEADEFLRRPSIRSGARERTR